MKFNLVSEQVRQRVIAEISALPLSPVHEVSIKEHKRNRSAEQNAFYWEVVTVLADHFGYIKDDMHEELKRRFLATIFVRDDEGYASMWSAVESVPEPEKSILMAEVLRLTSTTKASVKQMTEFLEDVIRLASENGVRLPAFNY